VNEARRDFEVAADHPAFAGHFPGHPVLPGVVLIAEALDAVLATTRSPATDWSVESAKFHAPVRPGARLAIVATGTASGGVRFEIRAGDTLVASGVFARSKERAA
jgi:3-hydroxymyristoyl/3-hydroxydecanoyl-(acyl carrier protein) dehydratase